MTPGEGGMACRRSRWLICKPQIGTGDHRVRVWAGHARQGTTGRRLLFTTLAVA